MNVACLIKNMTDDERKQMRAALNQNAEKAKQSIALKEKLRLEKEAKQKLNPSDVATLKKKFKAIKAALRKCVPVYVPMEFKCSFTFTTKGKAMPSYYSREVSPRNEIRKALGEQLDELDFLREDYIKCVNEIAKDYGIKPHIVRGQIEGERYSRLF